MQPRCTCVGAHEYLCVYVNYLGGSEAKLRNYVARSLVNTESGGGLGAEKGARGRANSASNQIEFVFAGACAKVRL